MELLAVEVERHTLDNNLLVGRQLNHTVGLNVLLHAV